MGSGFSKFKKQAKMLQQQFDQMQEELKLIEVTGVAGNGLIEIKMNGEKDILGITIKPECVDKDDIEGLQDLIIAAYKDAMQKVKEKSPESDISSSPFGF